MTKYSSEIRPWNGAPAVFVNGEPRFLAAPYLQKTPYESFADSRAGIYMVFDHDFDVAPPGRVNVDRITRQIDALLHRETDALVIVRTFPPAPVWWLDEHPEEEMRFDVDPSRYPGHEALRDVSWGSECWLEAVCRWYGRLCSVLHETYRGQVIGYQFGMGTCGENNPQGACTQDGRWFCSDFSPAMTRWFRAWLRRKYGSDHALQRAWGREDAALETAEVPDRLERLRTDWFTFRDPRKAQCADYYRAFAERVEEIVIRICRAIKEATAGHCLAGSHLGAILDNGFHGYLYHQMAISSVSRALSDPAVDLFTSPASYANRVPGGDATSIMPAGSYRLHNKLIYQDQDSRTHRVSDAYRKNFTLGAIPVDANETVGVLKRDFAHPLIRGYGLWWHAMAKGMYDDPDVGVCIAKLAEIGRRSLHFPRGTAPGAAMIADESSNFHQACTNRLIYPMLYRQRQFFWSRAGMAWDVFLRSDLGHLQFPTTKLFCFLNTFCLSDEDIAVIRNRLRGSDATALWFYAPGIQSPEGFDIERMRRLTGFRFNVAEVEALPRVTITTADHPYTRGVPMQSKGYCSGASVPLSFGTGPLGNDEREGGIGPLFYVDDPEATVLGELDALQEPGFCVKEMDGWTSVYAGAPMINQYLLANIARAAGVHVYSEDDDVVLPGRSFIMLHAVEGGEKSLRLPEPKDVYEPYEDREIGRHLSEFRDTVETHETKLYFLGSREKWQAVADQA